MRAISLAVAATVLMSAAASLLAEPEPTISGQSPKPIEINFIVEKERRY